MLSCIHNGVYDWGATMRDAVYYFRVLPDCRWVPFDIGRIHPLKQRASCRLYEVCKSHNVSSVYVFGSATQMRCHSGSDLDIAVKFTDEFTKAMFCEEVGILDENGVDIIDLGDADIPESLLKEIKKGVRVL